MPLWLVLTVPLLAGCSAGPFFCPVEAAYTEAGTIDSSSYRVKRDCFKSQTKKMKACYAEVQP